MPSLKISPSFPCSTLSPPDSSFSLPPLGEKLCISLGKGVSPDDLSTLARRLPFVEFRLDLMENDPFKMINVLPNFRRVIVTCRPGKFDENTRRQIFHRAIQSKAAMIDLETDCPEETLTLVRRWISQEGEGHTRLLVSHHDRDQTPSRRQLIQWGQRCLSLGGNPVKIACRLSNRFDEENLLSLLQVKELAGKIIPVGMGRPSLAIHSRAAALQAGVPWMYAAPEGNQSLPVFIGQPTAAEILASLQVIQSKSKEASEALSQTSSKEKIDIKRTKNNS